MGPGTHVAARILHKVEPVNPTDFSAMVHDVNYTIAAGDEQLLDRADDIANAMATGLPSLVMWAGLKLRKLFGGYEGSINHEEREKGLALKDFLLARYPSLSNKDFVI